MAQYRAALLNNSFLRKQKCLQSKLRMTKCQTITQPELLCLRTHYVRRHSAITQPAKAASKGRNGPLYPITLSAHFQLDIRVSAADEMVVAWL
jgi:hypothetical protein